MAIRRQMNWLGNMRVDVPHMRLVESAVAADFQSLSGVFMAGSQALIGSGVVILDTGMVGQPSNTLVLRMANASLLHGAATEPGGIFTVPATQPDDTLNAANAAVVGSFAPNVTNYIAIDLIRTADPTTQDTVTFRSSSTKLEFPQVIPLGRVLNYTINISTSNFGATPTLAPVAKVLTDVNNNIVSIEDCRQMFFRLGSGGTTPNPLAQYAWANRNETASATLFGGGDKDITSQHAFNRAVQQRLWELGSGEHWYSPADDRSVKLVYTVPSPWVWTGTNLTWTGLYFLFGNSTAQTNVVANQAVADFTTVQPSGVVGLTNLADGDVIYVDLNRTVDAASISPHRAPRTWLFANPPALPGTRHILAWRTGAQVFAGEANNDVTVTVPLPIATNLILGAVFLNFSSATPLTPEVVVCDGTKSAVANGLDRRSAGVLSIGTATATSLVFARAGVTSQFDGQVLGAQGALFTQSVVNGIGVEATGNGTGYGVLGHSTGVGVPAVYGAGHVGGAGGPGVRGVGGGTASHGVEGNGAGTGAGGYFLSGVTSGTYGVFASAQTGAGDGIGVYGIGRGAGHGVSGLGGASGYGVYGALNAAGTYAVYGDGTGAAINGTGVAGIGKGSGHGVRGTGGANGTGYGVAGFGGTGSGGGDGTYGVYALGGDGFNAGHGVYGKGGTGTNNAGGTAVGGRFEGGLTADGRSIGVWASGNAGAAAGIGVYAAGTGAGFAHGVECVGSGTGYGLHGTGGSTGYGVYGQGGSLGGVGVRGLGTLTSVGGEFEAGATGANLSLVARAGDPSGGGLVNGTIWHDGSRFNARLNGAIFTLGVTGTALPAITWQTPTVSGTNWTVVSGKTVSYYKDGNGNIHLKGEIQATATPSATICTLLAGYRPLAGITTAFIIPETTGPFNFAVLYINAGVVSLAAGAPTSGQRFSLDGVCFPAEG